MTIKTGRSWPTGKQSISTPAGQNGIESENSMVAVAGTGSSYEKRKSSQPGCLSDAACDCRLPAA